jgi:hypothetical protein
MNAIMESGLNASAVNNDPDAPGATGLFQLFPGRGEGVGFMNDRNGVVSQRKRELKLGSGITVEDQKNPFLNAAYTVSRFKEISGIANATSPQDATDKIIRLYEKPSSGDCLTSESNGRVDSLKFYFN